MSAGKKRKFIKINLVDLSRSKENFDFSNSAIK